MITRTATALCLSLAALVYGLCALPLKAGAQGTEIRTADAMSQLPPGAVRHETPGTVVPVCVPIGLAVDQNDNLYVGNHWTSSGCGAPGQITIYDSNGKELTNKTITKGINNPAGLAFDSKGRLYVADASNNWVTVYSPKRKQLTKRTLNTVISPSGVQVDGHGNIWVAERSGCGGEVQIFNPDGTVQKNITQDVYYPVGIAFQPGNGDAWVGNADTCVNEFSLFDPSGNFLNFYSEGSFTPTYDAFGKLGGKTYVYATDGLTNQVQVFNTDGTPSGLSITTGAFPYGIAFDSKGDFYVAIVGSGGNNNGSAIQKFKPDGILICTITATGCH